MRVTSSVQRRRSGVAAVEFAVVLPVLVVFLLGIWEVGRIVHVTQIISNAAREGARSASTGTRTFSQIEAIVTNYLDNSGLDTTGITVEITNETTSEGPTYDPTQAVQLDILQIRVSLPFDNVRWAFVDQISEIRDIDATVEWRSMKDIPIDVSDFGADKIPQKPL